MTAPSLLQRQPSADKLALARQAAARAKRLQGAQLSGHRIEVLPGLSELLPGGGLQAGATYSVSGSTALMASLLAAPSSAGLWCGLVGLPHFAAEAARDLGCDLEHLVMVPDPGPDWVNVIAALVDALPLVVARPLGAVSPSEANRLSARLRKRDGVLIVAGRWPRADLSLQVAGREWIGLGSGHGRLAAQRLRVQVEGRALMRAGDSSAQLIELWLPGPSGDVQTVPTGRTGRSGPRHPSDRQLVEAAG